MSGQRGAGTPNNGNGPTHHTDDTPWWWWTLIVPGCVFAGALPFAIAWRCGAWS